jgi:hypothetical protein
METQDNMSGHFHTEIERWDDLQTVNKGIDKVGQHICWLYKGDDDHKHVLLDYFKKGLELNEKMLYLAMSDERIKLVRNYLIENGIDPEPLERKGILKNLSPYNKLNKVN